VSETPTPRPATTRPIQYKGEDLESERGPGLGCFRFQLIVLAILIVLTPVSVALGWPYEVSAALLFVTLILLLLAGQTIIFLLRLVAAERRGRRAPLAPRTPTVGQIEDAGRIEDERQIEDARQIDEARTLEAAGDSGAVDVAEVEQATDAPGHRAAGQSAGDPRGDTTQPR
jgi:uncharacterized SAM-binding protein YcdF (DUF218 family)